MAGLYTRGIDPNFASPNRTAVGANAGIGAPGAMAIPRQEDEDFDAQQMAGLLGMLARQKKPGEDGTSSAPGAANGLQQGMAPIGNEGNFDMAPAMAQGAGALPNGGNFAMPPAGSGDAYQLGNVGAQGPLLSNFGGGIPEAPQGIAANPVAGAMPASIGGAGIPSIQGLDPSQLQQLQGLGMLGMLGQYGGGA